jgi:signal transduction histidine kinase
MELQSSKRPLQFYELYEQLQWFGRLRWLATAVMILSSFAGGRLGIPQLWPELFFVGVFVGLHNLFFHLKLRAPPGALPQAKLHTYCIVEIVLDLAVLLVVVYITGGSVSPVLPFFVFHMAIGTALLSTRTMYTIAGATLLGAVALYVAETSHLLTQHPIGSASFLRSPTPELNLVTLAVIVFGTVYLTNTVKRRSEEYRRIAEFVREEGRRKLERALQEIKDLERRKSHYMRISAHQLRSPLGTIKTSLQVLTQGYADPASERGGKLIAGAVERVDNLLDIVNDLLELAKIREGTQKAPWTRNVDINGIIAEILESLRPFAESRQIRLVPDLRGRAILQWGVPPDLRFAFENLIQNAIKYSNADAEVRVTVAGSESTLMISVADQGIGIPKDLQPDIFMEFIRAPNAKRHAQQGTGLGLAIVKAAVEQHGGTISLVSEEGVGSTFTVEMPRQNELPANIRDTLVGQSS